MAKYDYLCIECDDVFEVEMSYEAFDKARTKKRVCPKCKSQKTVRFIRSAHPVVYNGSGFYSTDNTPRNAE